MALPGVRIIRTKCAGGVVMRLKSMLWWLGVNAREFRLEINQLCFGGDWLLYFSYVELRNGNLWKFDNWQSGNRKATSGSHFTDNDFCC